MISNQSHHVRLILTNVAILQEPIAGENWLKDVDIDCSTSFPFYFAYGVKFNSKEYFDCSLIKLAFDLLRNSKLVSCARSLQPEVLATRGTAFNFLLRLGGWRRRQYWFEFRVVLIQKKYLGQVANSRRTGNLELA